MDAHTDPPSYQQARADMKSTVVPFGNPPSDVNSLFGANTGAALSSAPFQALIAIHRKKTTKEVIIVLMIFGGLSLIGFGLLVAGLLQPKCLTTNDCNSARPTLLPLGAALIGTGIVFGLICAFGLYYTTNRQFRDLTDERITQQPIIWRLDGAEWTRFLDYIHGPDRQWTQVARRPSFCCRRGAYTRLRNRQHGHIILYWNGLIIDELHFVSFSQFELQYIQLMTFDPQQCINGLRVHTCFESREDSRDCYFDIFAPSHVPIEQVQAIIQSFRDRMKDPWGRRLAALGVQLFT